MAHALQRIIMGLTEKDDEFYNSLLNSVNFGRFFVHYTRKQYMLLTGFIKTKTEDLHVIEVGIGVKELLRGASQIF